MHRKPMARARAFTIVPLAVVLWAALILFGVLLWKKTPPPGYVPGKSVGPGQFASVILAVLYGGFWVFMLGPVADKKGKKFANVAAVITLGFAAFMFGLSYAGLTADQRNLGKASPAGGPASVKPAPSGAGSNPTAQGLQRIADQLQRQNEQAHATRPAAAPPVQVTPPSPAAAPKPSAAVPVVPTNPPPAAPALPSEDPRVVQVRQDVAKSIDADAAAVIAKFDALSEAAAKPFKRDMREMEQRMTDAAGLKADAEALKKRLDGVGEEVAGKLRQAGLPESDLTGASIRVEVDLRVGPRGVGCVSVSRFADVVIEHADLFRSKFDKWSIDGKGQVKWKDPALQGQARSLQFRVDADIKSGEMTRGWLKGE